jgi:hypothetical protein
MHDPDGNDRLAKRYERLWRAVDKMAGCSASNEEALGMTEWVMHRWRKGLDLVKMIEWARRRLRARQGERRPPASTRERDR